MVPNAPSPFWRNWGFVLFAPHQRTHARSDCTGIGSSSSVQGTRSHPGMKSHPIAKPKAPVCWRFIVHGTPVNPTRPATGKKTVTMAKSRVTELTGRTRALMGKAWFAGRSSPYLLLGTPPVSSHRCQALQRSLSVRAEVSFKDRCGLEEPVHGGGPGGIAPVPGGCRALVLKQRRAHACSHASTAIPEMLETLVPGDAP